MEGMDYLKKFDHQQLWRFFVDGRFHRKYDGWVKYESREVGSIQALLNGFEYMLEHLYSPQPLNSHYLRNLHKICMINVQTSNIKSSPGDIRYQRSVLPFFVKTTTLEHIQELLILRENDNCSIFTNKTINDAVTKLNAKEVYQQLQKDKKLNYIAWYPEVDQLMQDFLDEKGSLAQFYDAKHHVQTLIVYQMELILTKYNQAIIVAKTEDEKLNAIALLVRELEILHPFPDGNCRVFACILLSQLLIQYGFPPAILKNPNLDAEVSLSQWVEEIKKGMQHALELINDPKAKIFNYSIDDMSTSNMDKFTQMSSSVSKKINDYSEILLTPEKLANYTGGKWINSNNHLRYSCLGNRGSYRKGSIYFAIGMDDWQKDNKDIREELNKRIDSGIRGLVVDDEKYTVGFNIPILLVDDLFKALDDTAINIRQDSDVKSILVTGTEGKTGTKIQLHHLLNGQIPSHAVLNSANSDIPILSSIINLQQEHRVEINEVSVDANFDKTIQRAKTVNPDLCFFSNISTEHMHVHKSLDNVIKAKSAVVEGLREDGVCLVNSTMNVFDDFVLALNERRRNVSIKTYGMNANDDAQLVSQNFNTERLGWHITANILGDKVDYFLPLVQQHAPIMSVGILLTVKLLGYDLQQAAEDYSDLSSYESMGKVYKIDRGIGQFIFYDQSRRASISGVRSVFKDLENFQVPGHVIALFGSISSVNDNEWTRAYHEELADLINDSKIDGLYTTGPNIGSVYENLADKSIFIKHSDDFNQLYRYLMATLRPGDLLLIQGYMRLNLDRIAKKVINYKDDSGYDKSIEQLNLPKKELHHYKNLLISKSIEEGKRLDWLKDLYAIDSEFLDELSENQKTHTEHRANLLYNFFTQIEQILVEDYQLDCVNKKISDGSFGRLIYSKDYCTRWFNNLDKITSKSSKHLFGSFFSFGHEKYSLFIIVGTFNLHVGVAKYELDNGEFKFINFDESDYEYISNIYAKPLLPDLKLQKRSWGNKWVTIDAGNYINVLQASIFSTMTDPQNSHLLNKKIKPLIEIIKNS